MDHLSLPPSFEQTTVYQLASVWLNPSEDQEVLEWLLALTHPDPEQRRKTVFHMAQRRDARVRVPLLVALHDSDSRVRGEAAHAMLFFRDARAVESLITVLQDARARSAAALALGLLQDGRAVEPLLAVFQEEIARRQQQAAARGVLLFPDHDLEMIIAALAMLGDQRAVEPLIAVLHNTSWYMQSSVARALGQLQDRRAMEPLLAALQETLARVSQKAAAQQLGPLPILPEGLFWALGVFRDRRTMKPLLTLLAMTSLSMWDRKLVVVVLGQLGDVQAVNPLCAVFGEKSIILRTAAARALGLLGDSRAVEVLCSALTERSGHLRAAAAKALGQVGDARAIEPLLTVLQDRRMSVRRAALWSLCRVGDERVVEPLLALLQQGSGPQRRAAVEALGRIGDVRAVEPLAIHHDQDRTVRTAVRKALDRLRPKATFG